MAHLTTIFQQALFPLQMTQSWTCKVAQMPNAKRKFLDVIVVLAQKDFKVRYRNSVLGFIWSLLNPLAFMIILTLVFSYLLRLKHSELRCMGSNRRFNLEIPLNP